MQQIPKKHSCAAKADASEILKGLSHFSPNRAPRWSLCADQRALAATVVYRVIAAGKHTGNRSSHRWLGTGQIHPVRADCVYGRYRPLQNSEVLGQKCSPEMIAICNEKKAAAGVDNIEFKVSATTEHDPSSALFDVVLGFSLLHLVNDLDKTLAQVNQVLKPGGIFISKTPCLSETLIFSLIRWPLIIAQKFGFAPHVLFFNVEQLDLRVKRAGFELVHGYTTEKQPRRRYIAARKKA